MTHEEKQRLIACCKKQIAQFEHCLEFFYVGEKGLAEFIVDVRSELQIQRIALAALEAEPLRYLNKFSGVCVSLEQQPNASEDELVYQPLFTVATPVALAAPVKIPDFRIYCGSNVKYRVAKDMIAYAIREAGHEVERYD